MIDIAQEPWTRDSTWRIVGADLDLEHVFAVQTQITFKFNDGGFNVVPVSGPTKLAACFKDTFLERTGSVVPALEDVDGIDTLANFSALSAVNRSNIMDMLAQHVDETEDLLRLEGMITIPCHETDAQLKGPPVRQPHTPLPVQTKICVYQINGPAGEAPFLLIRAPLSPTCPRNGNGTVAGQP